MELLKCNGVQVDDIIPIVLPAVYCRYIGVVLKDLLGGTTF